MAPSDQRLYSVWVAVFLGADARSTLRQLTSSESRPSAMALSESAGSVQPEPSWVARTRGTICGLTPFGIGVRLS